MKLQISYDGLDERQRSSADALLNEQVDNWLRQDADQLAALTGAEVTGLWASVIRDESQSHPYEVGLRLHVPPRKTLVARSIDDTLEAAVSMAGKRLAWQLQQYRNRLRRQRIDKRQFRRERLRQLHAEVGQSARDSLPDVLQEVLPQLKAFIHREMAFMQAQGELFADYPSVDDMVDEVLLQALRDWQKRPQGGPLLPWLVNIASERLNHEAAQSAQIRDSISSEQRAPEDAREQAEKMVGEEVYEYWQPDQYLRIEDLLDDANILDPAASHETVEAVSYLLQLLAELPLSWRRSWTLYYLEGLQLTEIVRLMNVDRESLEIWLDQAALFLRTRLADAGLEPDTLLPGEPAELTAGT